MKITFNKKIKYLSSLEKVSTKGNKYKTVVALIDGLATNLYCPIEIPNLEFGTDLEVTLQVIYGTNFDRLEILKLDVI